MTSIVAAILLSGLFSYPLSVLPVQILLFCGLAQASSQYKNTWPEKLVIKIPPKRHLAFNHIQRFIFLSVSLSFLFFGTLTLSAFLFVGNGNKSSYPNYGKALLQYKFLLGSEPWFVLAEAESYLRANNVEKAIEILEKAKTISSDTRIYYTLANLYRKRNYLIKAEEQYLVIYHALPALMRPKYELANFYFESGQIKKWQTFSKIVLEFKPKVESFQTAYMQQRVYQMMGKKIQKYTNKKNLYYDE